MDPESEHITVCPRSRHGNQINPENSVTF